MLYKPILKFSLNLFQFQELLTDAREAMPGNCILEHCHARFSVDFQRFKAMTGGIYHNFHDDCLNVLIEV